MERGVGTGARIEADALTLTAGISHRAITERILWHADRAGQGAALIDAADGTATAWPRFAQTVRAAASALGRRGVADGDTVGVLVEDAVSYAIAVHAIRAAGATALGISAAQPDLGTADIAAQLNECRARMLITAAPLAGLATEAADRSWVRQVFSFGEAEGTTPFMSLLDEVARPGPGRTCGPAEGPAAAAGLASPGGLTREDVVVAAPPCGEGQAYASLLDLALLSGATIVAAPVTDIPDALRHYNGTAAIVPGGMRIPGIRPDRVFAVALGLRTRPSPWPAWRLRGRGRASWSGSA